MIVLGIADPTDLTLVTKLGFGPLGSYNGTHSVAPVPEPDLLAVNSEAVSEETPIEREGDPLQSFTSWISRTSENRTSRGAPLLAHESSARCRSPTPGWSTTPTTTSPGGSVRTTGTTPQGTRPAPA